MPAGVTSKVSVKSLKCLSKNVDIKAKSNKNTVGATSSESPLKQAVSKVELKESSRKNEPSLEQLTSVL